MLCIFIALCVSVFAVLQGEYKSHLLSLHDKRCASRNGLDLGVEFEVVVLSVIVELLLRTLISGL